MPSSPMPLMPYEHLRVHQRFAAESAKVPITAATIGPLAVLLAESLVILQRDLLLACIDADLAGTPADRDAREADFPFVSP
jgi:hypothetical protein